MSSIHRAPAGLKLGAGLALILGLAALPAEHALWGLLALLPLGLVAVLAHLALKSLLFRWLLGAPLLLGMASIAWVQPHGFHAGLALLVKSTLALLTLQLLTRTTPMVELLRTLRRLHVPEALCETIALLSRYSSTLLDEARRMRRARAARTLRASRFRVWLALGNSIGLLFVRAVARAERVQVAMRSRGGA